MTFTTSGPSELTIQEWRAMTNHQRREYVANSHKQIEEVACVSKEDCRRFGSKMFVMRLVATGWYFGKGATPDECRTDYEHKLARMIVDH